MGADRCVSTLFISLHFVPAFRLNDFGTSLFTFSLPLLLLLSSLSQADLLSVPKGGSRCLKAPGFFFSSLLIGLLEKKKKTIYGYEIYPSLNDRRNIITIKQLVLPSNLQHFKSLSQVQ